MGNVQQLLRAAQDDLKQKKFQEACDKAHQIIKTEPNNSSAWHILGLASMQQNYFQEAIGYLKKAVRGQPKALYYFNLAIALKKVGQLNEAIESYRQCLKLNPKMVRAWSNLGNAYRAQDKIKEAERCYQKAVDLEPANALAHFNLAILYHLENRLDDAIKAYRRTIKYDPSNAKAYTHLGTLYSKLHRYEKSLPYFEKALALDPYLYEAYNHYGSALVELERYNEAEKQLRKALKLNPKSTQTLRKITLCKTYTDAHDKDAQYILKLLENPNLSQEDKIQLYFALGKINHEAKSYDKAFQYYKKGNELHYRLHPFNIYALQDYVEEIKSVFNESFILTHKNQTQTNIQPVLILGHPRSGKSLLESMLATHAGVSGAGEVGLVEFASKMHTEKGNQAFPQWVPFMQPEHAQDLVERYENKVLRDISGQVFCIDTMVANVFYLGLFVLLFPNVKIIVMDRDLKDLAISMYFNYFVRGHYYGYDLKILGQYFRVYQELIEHWKRVLAGQIHEVHYDALVLKPLETLKDVLGYLSLDSSNTQLDLTLETEHIGISKHYESNLSPLQEGLTFDPTSHQERIRHVLTEATQKHKNEQLSEASKLYRYVLQLEPDNPVATHLLGVVAFDEGSPNKAIEWIEKAIQINPDYAQAHNNLAAIYQHLNQVDKAQHHYHLAQKLFKVSDIEKYRSLTQEHLDYLKSAFLRDFPLVKQFEKKLLYKGEGGQKTSKVLKRGYCKDLSYGSYRVGGSDEQPAQHSDAWHFLFKHLKIVESIYQHPEPVVHVLNIDCGQAPLRRFIEGNASMNESKEVFFWGTDASADDLEQAVSANTSIESGAAGNFCPTAYLIHDSTLGLPFRDEFFNIVVSFENLQYYSLKSGVQCLHEMARVLKQDGVMVLSITFDKSVHDTVGSLGFDKLLDLLSHIHLELVETLGYNVPVQRLMQDLKKEHKVLTEQLLRVHPANVVAAILSPLYPQLSSAKVLVLKKYESQIEDEQADNN